MWTYLYGVRLRYKWYYAIYAIRRANNGYYCLRWTMASSCNTRIDSPGNNPYVNRSLGHRILIYLFLVDLKDELKASFVTFIPLYRTMHVALTERPRLAERCKSGWTQSGDWSTTVLRHSSLAVKYRVCISGYYLSAIWIMQLLLLNNKNTIRK